MTSKADLMTKFFPVNPWNRAVYAGGLPAVKFEITFFEEGKQDTLEQLKDLAKNRITNAFLVQKEYYEAQIKAIDEF